LERDERRSFSEDLVGVEADELGALHQKVEVTAVEEDRDPGLVADLSLLDPERKLSAVHPVIMPNVLLGARPFCGERPAPGASYLGPTLRRDALDLGVRTLIQVSTSAREEPAVGPCVDQRVPRGDVELLHLL